MTPRYEWNAIPNKHRDHTDDELIRTEIVLPKREANGEMRSDRGAKMVGLKVLGEAEKYFYHQVARQACLLYK